MTPPKRVKTDGHAIGSAYSHLREAYIDNVASYNTAKAQLKEEMLASREGSEPDGTGRSLIDIVREHRFKEYYEEFYPSFLSYTVIIQSALLFEYYIHNVCGILEDQKKTAITHRDLKGTGIEQGRIFLAKFCGYNIAEDSRWQTVCDLMSVRNQVVHSNGYIAEHEMKKIREVMKSHADLSMDSKGRLVISSESRVSGSKML